MTITSTPVDSGVNVEALLGARAAFAETPEIAQFQWRSSVTWANGTHSLQGFGTPIVLGAGPCACTETRGRWGDYSAAALDPSDQNSIWLAGEILLGNNTWGTRISKIRP